MEGQRLKPIPILFIILCLLLTNITINTNAKTDLQIQNLNSLIDSEWSKTYGGVDYDQIRSFQQTYDGGYILCGGTRSYGINDDWDVWIVKTDTDGNELWNRSFGDRLEDYGYSIVETDDNGFVITGYKTSNAGESDIWLIKTDRNGKMVWNTTIGGSLSEWGNDVITVQDGFLIVGNTYSFGNGNEDVWLIKTDKEGKELWNKTYGGRGDEKGKAVIQDDVGGFIIAGYTNSYGLGSFDVWLIKTDEYGKELWNRTYGGISFDRGENVIQTKDGGFVITGESRVQDDIWDDVFLIKTDNAGEVYWRTSFKGVDQDIAYTVLEVDTGGYVIAGSTESFGAGNFKAWLIRTDINGSELWNKTFGERGREVVYDVIQVDDGSYVLAGLTSSYGSGEEDAWLIKCQDYDPPIIRIVKPEEGHLYIGDFKITVLRGTVVIGGISFEVEPFEYKERLDNVAFYVSGVNDPPWNWFYETEPRAIISEPPYIWRWMDPPYVFGPWLIRAVGLYGPTGAHCADSVNFWMFDF